MSLPPTLSSVAELTHILQITKQQNGFAKLNSTQRKLLLAAVLASIIPADGRIHATELEHFSTHLKQRYQFNDDALKQAIVFVRQGLAPEELKQASKQLPDMLSIEDRVNLVGMLWDLALCDHELHGNEEKLVYQIADQAGVPRKRVAEEQARATRLNGITS
jgi:uncharacterized tellurite resistance protein B-like protein